MKKQYVILGAIISLLFTGITTIQAQPKTTILLGDFDGDKLADLARFSSGSWSFSKGKGDGTFGESHSMTWSSTPSTVPFIGDFDGDGNCDIGVYNPNGKYYWHIRYSSGSGIFNKDIPFSPEGETSWPWPTSNPTAQIFTGDFNGDGMWDVGQYNPNGLNNWYIAKSIHKGFFAGVEPYNWNGLNSQAKIFTGDFNADGNWDIGSFNPNLESKWFIRYGNGKFKFNVAGTNPEQTAYKWQLTQSAIIFTGDINDKNNNYYDIGAYNPNLSHQFYIRYGKATNVGSFDNQTCWKYGGFKCK